MNDEQQYNAGEDSRAAQAGAVLFASGGPMKVGALARVLDCSERDMHDALRDLKERLAGTGLTLVMTDTSVAMATAPEAAQVVESLRKKALEGEIGQAGLEVLSIVLYRGPSTRATIDYIRGVNSSATIRNLVARGIVERVRSKDNAREFVYRPTADVLAHLGLREVGELPEYGAIQESIAAFEERVAREAQRGAVEEES